MVFALLECMEHLQMEGRVPASHFGRRCWSFGWYNFVIAISALPSSLIFGALYESFGPATALGWGAALALIAGAV
jgi:hypothetical protein